MFLSRQAQAFRPRHWLAAWALVAALASGCLARAEPPPERGEVPAAGVEAFDASGPAEPTPTAGPVHPEDGRLAIVIDPGHGGPYEVGAVHRNAFGEVDVVEKAVNLRIALKLRALLEAEGFRVVLTRDSETGVAPEDTELRGYSRTRADLKARVELANREKAQLFISIHNNGSTNPESSGTEVWYSPGRPFGDRNWLLATSVQHALVERLRGIGHDVVDRGVKDDSHFRVFQGRTYNLYVLGPERENKPATQMPGILGESLFVTNHREAALLQREEVLDAIAEGYRDGILRYLEAVR